MADSWKERNTLALVRVLEGVYRIPQIDRPLFSGEIPPLGVLLNGLEVLVREGAFFGDVFGNIPVSPTFYNVGDNWWMEFAIRQPMYRTLLAVEAVLRDTEIYGIDLSKNPGLGPWSRQGSSPVFSDVDLFNSLNELAATTASAVMANVDWTELQKSRFYAVQFLNAFSSRSLAEGMVYYFRMMGSTLTGSEPLLLAWNLWIVPLFRVWFLEKGLFRDLAEEAMPMLINWVGRLYLYYNYSQCHEKE